MEGLGVLAPAHRFAHESPSRVPLTDWYETTDGKQVGFQARSVVGGVFKIGIPADGAAEYDEFVALIAAQPFAGTVLPGRKPDGGG